MKLSPFRMWKSQGVELPEAGTPRRWNSQRSGTPRGVELPEKRNSSRWALSQVQVTFKSLGTPGGSRRRRFVRKFYYRYLHTKPRLWPMRSWLHIPTGLFIFPMVGSHTESTWAFPDSSRPWSCFVGICFLLPLFQGEIPAPNRSCFLPLSLPSLPCLGRLLFGFPLPALAESNYCLTQKLISRGCRQLAFAGPVAQS